MNQTGSPIALVLVLAVAGGAAGGALSAYLMRDDAPRERAARGYDDSAIRSQLRSLKEDLQRVRSAAAPSSSSSPSSASPRRGDGGESSTIEIAKGDSAEPTKDAEGESFTPGAYVEALRGKRFTLDKSDQLIGYLSMHKEAIDPMIAELKKAIAADPSNPELYTALASVHVAKLAAGVAVGPAAGPVYVEAIKAYDKAIELNPDHWDARYNKAFTTSMAPEFIGLRPMSIRLFEDLVQRQDALPKQDDFRRTYMRLGTLYKDAGNPEKAKEIWTRGLQRFPGDKTIRAALDVLEEK